MRRKIVLSMLYLGVFSVAIAYAQRTKQSPAAKPDPMDPYYGFRYRISFGMGYVAGFEEMRIPSKSGMRVPIPGVPASPGQQDRISFWTGMSTNSEFQHWAVSGRQQSSARTRSISVDEFSQDGEKLSSYKLILCSVTDYQGTADKEQGLEAVTIKSFQLRCDRWQRN